MDDFSSPPHNRLIRNYLPTNLVVRAMDGHGEEGMVPASKHLASLVVLMRRESASRLVGAGRASVTGSGHFSHVRRSGAAWNLPDLADLCSMSRATFMRHFQDKLGMMPGQ